MGGCPFEEREFVLPTMVKHEGEYSYSVNVAWDISEDHRECDDEL